MTTVRWCLNEQEIVHMFQLLDSWQEAVIPQGTLSIAFLNLEESGTVHQQFFGDPAPTDVMTFPGDPDDDHAGDIAVCPDIALEATAHFDTSFNHELTLYLVHGWLHLAGYDDQDQVTTKTMRLMEQQAMDLLTAKNALPHFSVLTP
ncbi:MAG: rRNA maturation RNase YbeY [Verrucomicrobia bacterium]|nr:rRNA maturation RNase YbeY [Verrucomicrobiota bacterium]